MHFYCNFSQHKKHIYRKFVLSSTGRTSGRKIHCDENVNIFFFPTWPSRQNFAFHFSVNLILLRFIRVSTYMTRPLLGELSLAWSFNIDCPIRILSCIYCKRCWVYQRDYSFVSHYWIWMSWEEPGTPASLHLLNTNKLSKKKTFQGVLIFQ